LKAIKREAVRGGFHWLSGLNHFKKWSISRTFCRNINKYVTTSTKITHFAVCEPSGGAFLGCF
jgi:hypothetical protein